MKNKKIHGKTIFMAVLFVSSVCILTIKLLNPTSIHIFIDGNEIAVNQISGVFTYMDCMILVISSIILGFSGMYLLLFDSAGKSQGKQIAGEIVLEERKQRWKEVVKTLKDDEQKAYKAIIDSDGIINQSELSELTKISKSSVSRTLDLLESKGLVERRRRGMGNIILLK